MSLEKLTEEQLKNRETFLGRMFIKHPYMSAGFIMLSSGGAVTGLIYGVKNLFDYLLGK